ncbi:hypothetical protein BsWGS_22649 [Bradybaena similaris]
MAADGPEVNLLFFDTFYHEQNKEELNLDLIQFSEPVLVYELRVIPLKTQVEPNLGKGCRLGGTLPSEFKLEVFANNLDKPNASTFEKLGQLDYKENKNIQLKLDRHVPTDGLILKGWYRAVTLAVYGCVTVVMPPRDSPPPPPPPPLSGYQLAPSKTKIPGLELDDEDTHKPVTQQHPLDYINEQVQKRQHQQQQQHYSSTLPSASSSVQSLTRDPHKPPALEDSFVEVLRKASPRRDRDGGSSRDRASSRERDLGSSRDRASSRERDSGSSRDRASSRERDSGFSRERGSSHDMYDTARGRDLYDTGRDRDTFDVVRDIDTFDVGRDRDAFDVSRDRDTFDAGRERGTFDVGRNRDTFDVVRDRDAFDAGRDRDTFDVGRNRDASDVGRSRDTFDVGRDRDKFDVDRDRDTFDVGRDRDKFDVGRERETYEVSRDEEPHERSRGYDFPPEPKEPYDARDKDGQNDDFRPRSRDHDEDFAVRNARDEDRPRSREQERDREYAARRDRMGRTVSRDSDDSVPRSREGSREPRQHQDGESPFSDMTREEYLREREVDMEQERIKEVEERDREQKEKEAKEKEKREKEILEREMKEREVKEREREKELQKEREKEKEIQKEKEAREREQKEKDHEKELEKEREKEKELKEKELEKKREKEMEKEREFEKEREREKERELEREREREKETRSKDRYDHDWPSRTRTPPTKSRPGGSRSRTPPTTSRPSGSRSRSNSRSRRVSRSRHRSRSRSKPRTTVKVQSRSRSPETSRPPEPPLSEEEEAAEEEVEEEEETEEQEIYDSMSDRAPSRRQRRTEYDADAQEAEEGYEDISSDDEIGVMEDVSMLQVLDPYELEEEQWEGPQVFNPFDFYLAPMLQLKSPTLSAYEIESSRLLAADKQHELDRPKEAKLLLDIVSTFAEAEHQDRWVMALEEIPGVLDKGLSYLLTQDKRHDIVDVLATWVLEGCDPDMAMTQPDAAIKVRHLKIGIKLAGLLCALSENIALVLLRKGIQSKLLNLVESQFIVFSVKHLALRSLAGTTHFPAGMLWLLGIHPEAPVQDKDQSGYQRLIRSLLQPKIVKLTMSMTALLRKVHFFESLINLYCITERILSSTSQTVEAAIQKEDDEDEAPQLQAEDEKKILANLEEATKILGDPHGLIGQLHDAVPYNLLVDNHAKSADTIQAVYNVAAYCHLLETVFALLSCPLTASSPSIYLAVQTLLQQFMSSQEGLLFLCAHADTTGGIIRCLLQAAEESEDSGEDFPSRQLGLELVYHIQVLQLIDQLVHRAGPHARGNRIIDDPEVISVLHGLYSTTSSTVSRDPLMGRHIVAKVLGFDVNLEALLPFLEKTGDEEADILLRKSVCANYCIQLLLTAIKTSPKVSMLERYGHRLLSLSQDSTSAKMTQLQEWLAPVKKVTSFDLDGLSSMISQLKVYTDDVKKVPPGLITTIRMIYSLVAEAAVSASVDNMESLNEARYRYTLVELYSAECYPIFINILQKLSESQLKVWQQGIPYTTDQWLTYFSLIKPTLSLVHATLCQLIQAFRTEGGQPQVPCEGEGEGKDNDQEPLELNSFKDLTSVPTLLELHTVMCSVPTSSLYNSDLTKIQKDIVDTLLAFTQEDLQQTQTDDALSKSLWTLMLKELLKYTIKSPYTYMSGLLVLSELLPLPFPLHTKSPLTDEEMDAAVMARKLWSVHLQSATPELFAVLDTLSGTGCQPLQHLMRRVCWQIADLAAPSSLRVTKILLDILMLNLKPKKPTQASEGEQKEGEDEMTAVRTVSIHTAKTLNLLAYLLSHPGIKAALLQLIGSSINNDAKYSDFLPIMLQLLNQAAETPAEIQAQEGIVSMIQNLCDLEISMVNTDLPVTLAEHLANSLPESVLMADIVAALLEHIGNNAQSYASILPCLRTLIMLTDHDYGFFHIKISLERNAAAIHSLLNRINNTFSKDNSDCLSALSDVLELLRLLTTIDVGEDVSLTRTKVMSHEDLRRFVCWKVDVDVDLEVETRHPLEELEDLSKREESLETVLESITSLTSILRKTASSPQDGDTNLEEIVLPVPAPLTDLFNQRAIFTILDTEDERLSPSYWLANPAADEPDAKPEVLRCDLQAICELHLPDFNLEQELKKETSSAEEDIVRPKRPKDRRISHEVININRGKPGRFVAPMRGRGIISHGMMPPRNNDPFRARASNTSRPPSMHVDDFVKMENSQQPTPLRPPLTPTMAPPVRDGEKEMVRGRIGFDRGAGFGLNVRNRYFTPPASYRQDMTLHTSLPLPPPVGHTSHRGGSRGGLLSLDRARPNFISPRPFARGPDRQGPPQMDRHGTRNGRFSPGGRGSRGGQWGRVRDMGEGGRFAGGGFRGRRDGNRHARSFTK